MRLVNLGKAGLCVSRLCLGMMSYPRDESRESSRAEPVRKA
jgi:aryl-alcohol dehydrogenase-like predicted oxidoreductase